MAQLGLNDVWREAAERVEREAGVLFTIAAAFVMLPGVLVYILYPQIAAMAGRPPTPDEVRQIFPGYAVASLVQLFGQLGLIAVATDGGRSTVSIALHHAFGALPRVLLAFLILFLGIFVALFLATIAVGVPVALANGGAPLDTRRMSLWLMMGLALPCLYLGLRLAVFTVNAVAERRAAFDALKTSWRITRGHVLSILMIMALSIIGMWALQGLVSLVTGGAASLIDKMTGSSGLPLFFAYIVGSAVGAVATTYFTMILVVIHRRLSAATY